MYNSLYINILKLTHPIKTLVKFSLINFESFDIFSKNINFISYLKLKKILDSNFNFNKNTNYFDIKIQLLIEELDSRGQVFLLSVVHGHLQVVKYLVEVCNVTITQLIFNYSACKGHIDILIYFVEKCKYKYNVEYKIAQFLQIV